MTSRSYWTAVWCGFLVLTIGLGVRQSFGIFLKPVSAELHVGRELFSFGTAAVDAADGRRGALLGPAGRPLRLGADHRRRRRGLCAGHDRDRHDARRLHADPGQRPGRHRPVGRDLRPGAGRDPARGAAREAGAGRRHLLGRRLVRPVLHRAAGGRAAELFRRLAADHVGAHDPRRADHRAADRAERPQGDRRLQEGQRRQRRRPARRCPRPSASAATCCW